MKRYLNLIFASILLPLFFMACQKEYQPGAPDQEGCYGVYFQDLTAEEASVVLAPTDEKTLEFKVYREVKEGQITVPCSVNIVEGGAASDLIAVSEIVFEDGQEETTVTIDATNIEKWKYYDLQLTIDDPMYRSNYSVNSNDKLSFRLSLEEWNMIGEDSVGRFSESVIFSPLGIPIAIPQQVLVQENADTPGIYRVLRAYNPALLTMITGMSPQNLAAAGFITGPQPVIHIDATDPQKVTLEKYRTGWSLQRLGGPKGLYDICMTPGAEKYGVYQDGVILFEKGSICLFVDGAVEGTGEATLFLPQAQVE